MSASDAREPTSGGAITRHSTPESLAAVQAAIALLAEAFPKTFFMYERRRRPLKIGIHLDILAVMDGAITPEELSNALRIYVHNNYYLDVCRRGAVRIDLNGEPAGEISAQDAACAAGRLTARQLRQATQKKFSEPAPAKPESVKPESVKPDSESKRFSLAELKTLGRVACAKLPQTTSATPTCRTKTRHAARRRRRVSCDAMPFAVRFPGNRTATEVKIGLLGIATRPTAISRGERENFFRSARAGIGEGRAGRSGVDKGGVDERGVDEGGCLDVCRDGWLRRRFDEERSGRLRRSAAICPEGDSDDGSLLDLVNRHCSRSQEAQHNTNAAGDAAIAVLPAPHAPRADAEQPGNAVLCEAKRAQHLAELARSCVLPPASWVGRLDHVSGHRRWHTPPGRTARS
jgi:sRNA-binding protein